MSRTSNQTTDRMNDMLALMDEVR